MKINRNYIGEKSSFIQALGYDQKTKKLAIVFKNKKRFVYDKVPADVVEALISAESVGSAYNEYVKGMYDSEEA